MNMDWEGFEPSTSRGLGFIHKSSACKADLSGFDIHLNPVLPLNYQPIAVLPFDYDLSVLLAKNYLVLF